LSRIAAAPSKSWALDRLFLLLDVLDLGFDVLDLGGPGHGADAGPRTGLVHDVDGLVRAGKRSVM
jgi:hypothetical protein